jgi:WD40 repeat protein
VSGGGGDVKIWNAETGEEIRTLKGHKFNVTSCSYSPDGGEIVSGDGDGDVKIWNAETGKEIKTSTGHVSMVSSCSYSPDGTRIVSGSYDNTLKIWDANTGKEINALLGHTDVVRACSYSPDGTRIVSGSYDNTLKIWDANTGKEIRTLKAHNSWVNACLYSPDGGRIASGSDDKTIKIWDAETGEEIYTFYTSGDVNSNSIAFSQAGYGVVAGGAGGNVYILQQIGFDFGPPIITPVRLYLHSEHRWDSNLTAKCSWCGKRFTPKPDILDTVRNIKIQPQHEKLLSKCPYCHKPLRFNLFIVDNKERYS